MILLGPDRAFSFILDSSEIGFQFNWFYLSEVSESHNYTYSIDNAVNMEVLFIQFVLLNSNTIEVTPHGNYKLSIKTKQNILENTSNINSAGIYFDNNEPKCINIF